MLCRNKLLFSFWCGPYRLMTCLVSLLVERAYFACIFLCIFFPCIGRAVLCSSWCAVCVLDVVRDKWYSAFHSRHSRIRDFLTKFFSVYSPMEFWHKIPMRAYLWFAWPCCLLWRWNSLWGFSIRWSMWKSLCALRLSELCNRLKACGVCRIL